MILEIYVRLPYLNFLDLLPETHLFFCYLVLEVKDTHFSSILSLLSIWFITRNWAVVQIESNIHAPVLLNLSNLLQKSDQMLSKPIILSLSATCLINSIIILSWLMKLFDLILQVTVNSFSVR